MHDLATLMTKVISAGLKRKTITSCSKWSESYRMMGTPFPGLWTFDHHPWLLEMHDASTGKVVGQKAAQMGYTEWAMNTAFYSMDVRGLDVLYILPTSDDASDFSAGRFDPALELSDHLRDFFADVNNVGLKRAGSNILYVRGSHSRSKLKSIPTPVIIFDEVDEMPPASIALAEERQSGQIETKQLFLSTPTIEDFGINAHYKLSRQNHYTFECPACSKYVELIFPDSLVITGESLTDPALKNSHLICHECKKTLPVFVEESGAVFKPWLKHKTRGGTAHFVPSFPERDDDGFHVSQFYSMAKVGHPYALALAKIKADLDPTYAQEFWNSKLGLTYEAEGARVTEENLNNCIGHFKKGVSVDSTAIRTMGIDVGSVLHIIIKEFKFENYQGPGASTVNDLAKTRILYEGHTDGVVKDGKSDFDAALRLFMEYQCHGCVVDAEPERREAMRFAQKLWGRVLLCDYLFSQQGREAQVNEQEATIKVNRTAWMDLSLGRYRNKTVGLPVDITLEFRRHIREPVRIYKEDKFGNKYGVYESVNADHLAHADTYAEIALPMACSLANNQDIENMY